MTCRRRSSWASAGRTVRLSDLEDKTATNPTEVAYSDTNDFDTRLYEALSAGYPEVNVLVPGTVPTDAIPTRLARWLTAVKRYGGTVQGRRIAGPGEEASSQLVQVMVDMAAELLESVLRAHRYKAAADYNCVVFYA